MPNKILRRSSSDRIIAGVCGGIARYFDLDPTIVRVLYVVVSFFSAAFPGALLYLVLMLVMPSDDE